MTEWTSQMSTLQPASVICLHCSQQWRPLRDRRPLRRWHTCRRGLRKSIQHIFSLMQYCKLCVVVVNPVQLPVLPGTAPPSFTLIFTPSHSNHTAPVSLRAKNPTNMWQEQLKPGIKCRWGGVVFKVEGVDLGTPDVSVCDFNFVRDPHGRTQQVWVHQTESSVFIEN